MRRLSTHLPIGALFFASVAPATHGQVVAVRGTSDGEGVLRGRGGECFVITPRHVVDRLLDAAEVMLESGAPRHASVAQSTDLDLSILRITDAGQMSCEPWPAVTDLSGILRSASTGALSYRELDGSRSVMTVTLRNVAANQVTIRPASPTDHILRGMSGALLTVDGTPAGILRAVTINDGDGQVYRLDYVERVIGPFFTDPAAASNAGSPNRGAATPTPGPVVSYRADYAVSAGQAIRIGEQDLIFAVTQEASSYGGVYARFDGTQKMLTPGEKLTAGTGAGQCTVTYLGKERQDRFKFAVKCNR